MQGLSCVRFRALAHQAERGRGSGVGVWLLPVVCGAGAQVRCLGQEIRVDVDVVRSSVHVRVIVFAQRWGMRRRPFGLRDSHQDTERGPY